MLAWVLTTLIIWIDIKMTINVSMTKKKRLAIFTSGGDCPGLNTAIRAVLFAAERKGYEVVGIENGTEGLLSNPKRCKALSMETFDPYLMKRGGTFLGALNKGDPYTTKEDRSREIIKSLKELDISKLIIVGGDGSMSIVGGALKGNTEIQFIGIPKTIDNDVGLTEKAIGFESAVSVATESLDNLQATASSHNRIMILEVMGRDAGHIAINTGIAGGADVILIPEIPYDINKVVEKIKHIHNVEKRLSSLIVVSEAVKTVDGAAVQEVHVDGIKRYNGIGDYIAKEIAKQTGYETRANVLGHIQRGCPPNAQDRILASALGTHAVELIDQGITNRMVAWSGNKVIDVAIEDVIAVYNNVDLNGALVKTARALGICLGD